MNAFCNRYLIVFFLLLFSKNSPAQEICGLTGVGYTNLFKNGFEVLLATTANRVKASDKNAPAKSNIDLGLPMGMAPIPNGGSPTIVITDPPADGVITGKRLQVRGSITGPVNTGVAINGVPAYIQGNQFVSRTLTLPVGNTILIATATTMDGASATTSRTVTTSAESALQFKSQKVAEFSNKVAKFDLQVGGAISVQSITADFNGDGTPEFSGSNPALVPRVFQYTSPGIYTAEIKIVTMPPGSQTIVAKTIVGAIDIVSLRTQACSVYGALRTRIAANDVAGAVNVFPQENRPPYTAFLNDLGANRPIFAGRLGTIATGLLSLDDANLTLITIENGQPNGYRLRVAQGRDGVWRIEDL
jgi:hypothetical protein